MAQPHYSTTEGIWSKGKREEAGYRNVQLDTPYSDELAARALKEMDGQDDAK